MNYNINLFLNSNRLLIWECSQQHQTVLLFGILLKLNNNCPCFQINQILNFVVGCYILYIFFPFSIICKHLFHSRYVFYPIELELRHTYEKHRYINQIFFFKQYVLSNKNGTKKQVHAISNDLIHSEHLWTDRL